MAKDIPDYMRGFDLNDESWGVGPAVAEVPKSEPGIDPKKIDSQSAELSNIKNDVSSIKSAMNEIMQIVAEKDTITKELTDEDVAKRFKDLEKIVLPFLYNLSKTEEPYIHWPNRGPIIKAQIEKILKLTRG